MTQAAIDILCQGRSKDWHNPTCFAINRLPAHVPLRSFQSESKARAGTAGSRTQLLDGEWQFRLFDCPEDVPVSWLAEDAHTQDARAREVHLSDKKDTEFGFIKEKYVDDVEALLNSFFDDMVGMGMDELTAQLQLQKMIDTLAKHSKQGYIGMPT